MKGRRRKSMAHEPTLEEKLHAPPTTEHGITRSERLRLWHCWEQWQETKKSPPYYPEVLERWLARWREFKTSPEAFLEEMKNGR